MRKSRKIALGVVFALVAVLSVVAATAAYMLLHRVEGSYFVSDGIRLHYTEEGEGPPVILLHGFAVNADLNWRLSGISPRLAKEFHVVALDLRGHGLSDKPRTAAAYGMQLVEDVLRLMDLLDIERAHVVGYSSGGFVALKLATTHPERLLSVAVLGAGWENPEASHFLGELDRFAAALQSGKAVGPIAQAFGEDRRPSLVHRTWVKLMTGYLADKDAMVALIGSLTELAVSEAHLRSIQVPICGIVGGEDILRPGAEAMVGRVPKYDLTVIAGADHVRAPTRPEFQETLVAFLRRNKPQK